MWLDHKNNISHSAGQHPQEPKRNLPRLKRFKPWINVETGLKWPWARLVFARPASSVITLLLSCLWTEPLSRRMQGVVQRWRGCSWKSRTKSKPFCLACSPSCRTTCYPGRKPCWCWQWYRRVEGWQPREAVQKVTKCSCSGGVSDPLSAATEDSHLLISCCVPPQQTSYSTG